MIFLPVIVFLLLIILVLLIPITINVKLENGILYLYVFKLRIVEQNIKVSQPRQQTLHKFLRGKNYVR